MSNNSGSVYKKPNKPNISTTAKYTYFTGTGNKVGGITEKSTLTKPTEQIKQIDSSSNQVGNQADKQINDKLTGTTGIVELSMYRQKQAFKHHLIAKYGKLLELNKEVRNAWRLTNFAKKKILFHPCNITDSEIKEIEGIYRFRCHVIEIDDVELAEFNQIFEVQFETIVFEENEELNNMLLKSLIDEKEKQFYNLGKSKKAIKIPVLLDLRIYGPNPDIPVFVGNKMYQLDYVTKANIVNSYERVNPTSNTGDRYRQMLTESKILRDSYWEEIKPKQQLDQNQNHNRILQKAHATDDCC